MEIIVSLLPTDVVNFQFVRTSMAPLLTQETVFVDRVIVIHQVDCFVSLLLTDVLKAQSVLTTMAPLSTQENVFVG